MEVRVDETLCTGCEVCVDVAPEVLEMDDAVVKAKVTHVPEEHEAACQEAADICPSGAIIIE